MAGPTEFYLSSVWGLRPPAVTRVKAQMDEEIPEGAEIVYDRDYGWFRVTCRDEDSSEIRRAFDRIVKEIEDEVFEYAEEDIIDDEGVVRDNFRNEMFTFGDENLLLIEEYGPEEEIPEEYHFSAEIAEYPHKTKWDELDKINESFTIHDIVSADDLEQIARDSGTKLVPRLNGIIVEIGGKDEDALRKAQKKLMTMLEIKKMSKKRLGGQHLVYVEDYYDPSPGGWQADMRYMTNIDEKLTTSTLIDWRTVANLKAFYEEMYKQGASIRLCLYSGADRQWYPLLGPQVPSKTVVKFALEHRPTVPLREGQNLEMIEVPPPREPFVLDPKLPITTWDEVNGEVTKTAPAAPPTTPAPELAEEVAQQQPAEVLAPAPVAPPTAPLRAVSPTLSRNGSNDSDEEEIDEDSFDENEFVVTTKIVSKSKLPAPPPANKNFKQRPQKGISSQNQKTPNYLEDDLPVPNYIAYQAQLGSSGTTPTRGNTLNRGNTPGRVSTPVQGVDNRARFGTPSLSYQPAQSRLGNRCAQTMNTPLPKNLGVIPDYFKTELTTAIKQLLESGPKRRGTLTLRAEFGRAIFLGADETGLAFNDEDSPSDPWIKERLLRRLGNEYHAHVAYHFTKVLSTYGSDIKEMLDLEWEGKRMWNPTPMKTWTVYSFRCRFVLPKKKEEEEEKEVQPVPEPEPETPQKTPEPIEFIVEIEETGQGNPLSYHVRPVKVGGPLPVTIHAIRRHWDLQIAFTHVITDKAEQVFGSVAQALLKSFSVTGFDEKGTPSIRFALHQNLCATVTDVRVMTKWRHKYLGGLKSLLEITEVEQLNIHPTTDNRSLMDSLTGWEPFTASPRSKREAREKHRQGDPACWYEMAVVSYDAEMAFQKNASLQIGDEANWTVDQLLVGMRVLPALCQPALIMLTKMDSVGRADDNGLGKKLLETVIKRNTVTKKDVPGIDHGLGSQCKNGGSNHSGGGGKGRRNRGSNQNNKNQRRADAMSAQEFGGISSAKEPKRRP